MILSDKQRQLYQYCKEHKFITKATANDMLAGKYYHNGKKYVSEILGRMVKQGIFKRTGRGVYKLGSTIPQKNINPNQQKLF